MANQRDQSPRSRAGPRQGPQSPVGIDPAAIKAHVLRGDAAQIDISAEQLAKTIVDAELATNQVRNFYGSIAKLQSESDRQKQQRHMSMLRSRLAYLTARADGKADALWAVFDPLLKEAKPENVPGLCDFAEAIVAYHKYFEWQGKKEKKKGGSHATDE